LSFGSKHIELLKGSRNSVLNLHGGLNKMLEEEGGYYTSIQMSS